MIYKQGDRWSAKDANFAMKMAEQIAGTPLEILGGAAGSPVLPAVMNGPVEFGSSAMATLYDETAQPPTDAGEDPIEVWHDWFRDNPQTIEAGKRVGVIKQGEIYRIYFAECSDVEEPDDGQIESSATADTTINTWGPLPSAITKYEYGKGYIAAPDQYGFQITSPGYWRILFSFSVEGSANNTVVQIRPNTEAGPGLESTWTVRQATQSVTGTVTALNQVTQAEIDAAPVYLVIERNVSANVTWILTELSISKVSGI